ncbi:hypothetical protein GCM10011316_28490 [Roseibium aquae]|uniref:Uncharacterized protein n=1 Tax=Roseibium aquae TaxID=1323746 RepID=A0A916X2H4_9HYPH|nr:hypothetical protein [Roseibium aquae]GGB54727.1 hypothetical protein GCM10011316_28490 [Roseibium aquae]
MAQKELRRQFRDIDAHTTRALHNIQQVKRARAARIFPAPLPLSSKTFEWSYVLALMLMFALVID